MKPGFVETENVKKFQAAYSAMERRGAEEACLMVVDGDPGLGKTTALYHWVAQTQAIYLRAKEEWTARWFMEDLLEAFRLPPKYSFKAQFRQAFEALVVRQQSHQMLGRTFAVVLDEADHFSKKKEIVETIRDFSDLGDIPFVMVGMGKIRDNFVRFPAVSSRVAQYVRFERAPLDDVRRFLDLKCDAKVSPELVEFVHRATGGYSREIKEAIATIELHAKRNRTGTAEAPVTLADLSGQRLINDRRSGQPIIVPEAA